MAECRICKLPEERDGLCPGHREEWIRWASHRPTQQNDEGFDRWIERRVREMNCEPMVQLAPDAESGRPPPFETIEVVDGKIQVNETLGWLCEDCHWFTVDEDRALSHCDEQKHSLAMCPESKGRLIWMTTVMEGIGHFASGRAGVIATDHLVEQGVWVDTIEREPKP